MSADKSRNHKITYHTCSWTDWYPLFCLFFIFHFIHLQNVKMFTCNVHWVGCFCFTWLARPVVPVPFFLLLSPGDHFMRCLQAVPSAVFTRHRTFLSLMVGANILPYRQTQAVNFLRPAIGGWIVTEKLLFSLTVVSAVFGGCKTASSGSPSSTGFEPGADEAADPSASTLLLSAELATTLLLAVPGFPFKWLIVLLDHAKRDVGRWVCGCGCGRGVRVGALWPQVHTPTRILLSENETCVNHRAFCVYIQYIRDVFDVKTTKHIDYVIRNTSSVDSSLITAVYSYHICITCNM